MASVRQYRTWIFGSVSRAASAALTLVIPFALTVVAPTLAYSQNSNVWCSSTGGDDRARPAAVALPQGQPQMFTVIHTFTGGQDGGLPRAGLTMDRAGNFYGVAAQGGEWGDGTVYKLTRTDSGWIFNTLYSFLGGADGSDPWGRLSIGPNGSLYGTTVYGGGGTCDGGCGTVFNVRPQPSIVRSVSNGWNHTVLYKFNGGRDGGTPFAGDLIFDQEGNLYGTTYAGGTGNCYGGCGVVYRLKPSGQNWIQSVVHNFGVASSDGWFPFSGLVSDSSGKLYGTTTEGGDQNGDGTVYELTSSGSGWTEAVLYNFGGGNDGAEPYAGLILDPFGNLFGATINNGSGNSGTVFTLSSGSFTFGLVYSFTGNAGLAGGPVAALIMDSAGNLYGTARYDGAYGLGSVFKLTPSGSGSWTYTSLHDFTGGSDGELPHGSLAIGTDGNLYGTASESNGGAGGVVFEITL